MSYFLSIPKTPEVSVLSCTTITGSANGSTPFYLTPSYINGNFNPITNNEIVLLSGYEYFLEFTIASSNSYDINFSLEVDSNIVNTGWTTSTLTSTENSTIFYSYTPISNSTVKMKINSSTINSTIITDDTRLIIWRTL
jgi:hypothetical protein